LLQASWREIPEEKFRPLRFLLEVIVWITGPKTLALGAQRRLLLYRMSQFVGDKTLAGPVARCVLPSSKDQVMPDRECAGVDCLSRVSRSGSGMDADATEVVREERFKSLPGTVG
jgi:hypothetical protein